MEGTTRVQKVSFPPGKFARAPTMLTGLKYIDILSKTSVRVASVVEEVTKDGFTSRIELDSKWLNTKSGISILSFLCPVKAIC